MQIAGGKCAVCGRNVGTMREGFGCEPCDVVVHQSCVPNGNCPRCSRPFLSSGEVHSRPSRTRQVELIRPKSVTILGRLTLAGVPIGALIAVGGLIQMGTDGPAGLALMIGGLLVIAFSIALGNGLLKGQAWARRFYLWGTPLLMATDVAFGSNQNFRSGFSLWLFAVQVGVYAVWLFFLTRPEARMFFMTADSDPRAAAKRTA